MQQIKSLIKKSGFSIGALGLAMNIVGCSDDFGRAACHDMHGNQRANCFAESTEKQLASESRQMAINSSRYHQDHLGDYKYKDAAIYVVNSRQTHREYMPYSEPSDQNIDDDTLKLVENCHDEIRENGDESFLYRHYSFPDYRHVDKVIECAYSKEQEQEQRLSKLTP